MVLGLKRNSDSSQEYKAPWWKQGHRQQEAPMVSADERRRSAVMHASLNHLDLTGEFSAPLGRDKMVQFVDRDQRITYIPDDPEHPITEDDLKNMWLSVSSSQLI